MASETDPATVKRRREAADRQRVLRQRRRDGLIVMPLEVSKDDINGLIELGFLAKAESGSFEAQQRAFYRLFENYLN